MKKIIFAPLIGDETIGCFELLSGYEIDEVYYFYDLFPDKIDEANRASILFHFTPYFIDDIYQFEKNFSKNFTANDIILVPNINDNHLYSKIINRLGRLNHSNLFFYSIDMVDLAYPLKDYTIKRNTLYQLYPSRKNYFDLNEKSYKYEIIKKNDLIVIKTFTFRDEIDEVHYSLTFNNAEDFFDIIAIRKAIKGELNYPEEKDWDLTVIADKIMKIIIKHTFLKTITVCVWFKDYPQEMFSLVYCTGAN